MKLNPKTKFNSCLIGCWILSLGVQIQAQSLDESAKDNWHQWRGPGNNGVSKTATPPVEWSERKNIQWKVVVDGNGSSAPIIWEDKVFLLTAVNTGEVDPSLPKPENQPKRVFGITHPNTSFDFFVLCLDRNSGKEIWRQKATTKIPHEGHHGDNNFASASPFTDGQRLYCWFGSAGLYCYDLSGKKLWERDLGKAYMGASLGEGTSPVVNDGKLVIVRDHQRQSYIEVMDAATGKTLWKENRDEANTWATPAIVKYDGKTQVITTGTNKIRSYDLSNGEIIWQCGGLTNNAIPCPVVENDVVYCMTGYKGYSLLAIPLSSKGDITDSRTIIWKADKGTPYVPSPVLYDGQLFFTQSNQAILTSLDAKTGETMIERTRLPDMGNVYSSPVGADGRVYITSRNGNTLVIQKSGEFKELATNKLDDTFNSSPAIAGKQLFLRGRKFLYSIAERQKEKVAINEAKSIQGKVTDASGKGVEGVMISAFDDKRKSSNSAFSQADGSYVISGLRDSSFRLRARLLGQLDKWKDEIKVGSKDIAFSMTSAEGEDLENQRTADSGFSMLKWNSAKDKENYKMMCSYCHQTGSRGWRTPEQPIDWETMITRMDGFGGLYKHTQKDLVKRLVATYTDEAVAKWPAFVPPPAPSGISTRAKITEWDMGEQYKVMVHDIELGPDGLVYAVDMAKNAVVTLNPETGVRKNYRFPGKYRGPHSIELGNDGHMWFTLCKSGEMAKFNIKTKKFTIASSAEAPAKRGAYPHTLRINPKDPEGLIWYTDAGKNSCFSIHPKTMKVKEYHLLKKDQAVGAGKGESRGVTPYGIDYSPVDGSIWYSKLNGNRIGRIDPKVDDGDIKEWNPPFRGPRRLHVAQDGMVWVPGFGSGVFASFNPKAEKWKVYELPNADNQIPYALNIDSKGYVWICGTNSDSLLRFDPSTEMLVEFRMPTRVTYTREIEFGDDGSVWTCNSNGPARHTERGFGSIIKLELTGDSDGGGTRLTAREFKAESKKVGSADKSPTSPTGKLLAQIGGNQLPEGYNPGAGKNAKESHKLHQDFVAQRMKGLSPMQRGRVGLLWKEQLKAYPKMRNRGASFVKILEHVAQNEK